jgi:hypothetical protein
MADCALFPASSCKIPSLLNVGRSGVSLEFRRRDFHPHPLDLWTVKLVLGDLAPAVIYGLVTVIHAERIAPP